jgi:hypothetical protein
VVQCLEHAYIIVDKGKLTFPTSNLTMKNLGPMRGCEHGQRRVSACARFITETRAHARVCVVGNPRACARD